MSNPFINIHVHSEYSLSDGMATINKRLEHVKDVLHQDALTLTDHGNINGSYEFINKCNKYGIQPLLGLEAYMVYSLDKDKTNKYYHVCLYAKNDEGFKILKKLSYISNKEDHFYYHPRLLFNEIIENKENLIVTSACLANDINQFALNERPDLAEIKLLEYINSFDFYYEVMPHYNSKDYIKAYKVMEPILLKHKDKIKFLAATDSHYVTKEQKEYYQVFKRSVAKTDYDYSDYNLHLFSEEEMRESLNQFVNKEIVELAINGSKNFKNNFVNDYSFNKKYVFPKIDIDSEKFIRDTCYTRLNKMYFKNEEEKNVYFERLEFEFDVIKKMGFMDYFYIVRDIITYARNNSIKVNYARGSCSGSLLSYLIDITQVDPIKYELSFERFMNPQRIKMPDIDIDFESEGKEKITEYIINTYGEENVLPIINYSYMKLKSALKDACRGYGIGFELANELTKYIDDEDDNIDSEINKKLFEDFVLKYPEHKYNIKKAIGLTKEIIGQIRQFSKHAAGLLITDNKIYDYVPAYRLKDSLVSGYDKDIVDGVKLLKIDILGITELSNVKYLDKIVSKEYGIDFDLMSYSLSLLDNKEGIKEYIDFLKTANTYGLFQFGTPLMQSLIDKYKDYINGFEDLVVLNSLARPGAKKFIDVYFENKKLEIQGNPLNKIDPLIDDFYKSTYFVPAYQEQQIKILSFLTGKTLGEADIFRRKFENKDPEIYNYVVKFAKKVHSGLNENHLNKILTFVQNSCEYSFNRSHAVAYSMLGFTTLVSKYKFPYETYVSFLNNKDDDEQEDIVSDMFYNKIRFVLPTLELSQFNSVIAEINNEKVIILGLKTIKGLADKTLEKISKLNNSAELMALKAKGIKDTVKKIEKMQDFMQNPSEINYLDNFDKMISYNLDVFKFLPFIESVNIEELMMDKTRKIGIINKINLSSTGNSYRATLTLLFGNYIGNGGKYLSSTNVNVYIRKGDINELKESIKIYLDKRGVQYENRFTEEILNTFNIIVGFTNRDISLFEPESENGETSRKMYFLKTNGLKIHKVWRSKEFNFDEVKSGG